MTSTVSPDALACSFCGKAKSVVAKLVAGPGVFICNECVDLCSQVLAVEPAENAGAEARTPGATSGDDLPMLKVWDHLGDDELLAEMVRAHRAHENVDRAVAQHVTALRRRGVSWARIGEALGMARQSAWERFSGEE